MASRGDGDFWLKSLSDRWPKSTKTSVSRASSSHHNLFDLTEEDDYDDNAELERALQLSLQRPCSPNDEIIEIVEPDGSMKNKANEALKPTAVNKDIVESDTSFPIFSICSYNIWFQPLHHEKRMQKLASSIITANPRPLFVGFQEVTPFLRETLFPLLQKAGYQMFSQDIDMFRPYGCAIGVLGKEEEGNTPRGLVVDHGFKDYSESVMNRGLLWVIVKVIDWLGNSTQHVMFTTTHLESYQKNYPKFGDTYTGAAQRLSQIQQATQYCTDRMTAWNNRHGFAESIRMAIITGDLNWDDERKTSKGEDPNLLMAINQNSPTWIDAWKETNPGMNECGYTYDGKMNPMLGGNLRRRFDRCLVHSRVTDEKPRIDQVTLIGTEAIEGITWEKEVQAWRNGGLSGTGQYKSKPVLPSDHYGLLVVIGGSRSIISDENRKQAKRSKK